MELPFTASSNADTDDVDRKAKLLALLDQARVNRGLQPERNGDTCVGEDVALDARPPPIKIEPLTDVKSEYSNTPHSQEQHTPKCICSHSHQSSPASTIHESHALSTSALRERSLNVSLTTNSEGSESFDTVLSRNHARITSETCRGSSAAIQTAGEDARQSDATHPSTTRVAVLSSAPKPRIADLTGGREKVPRLQQLKPLQVPRNPTHPPQLEEKNPVKRAVQPKQPKPVKRAVQPKQPKPSTTNTSITLKKLELLTPDEYEDSELHGDFQHMLHILIPSNATTALLERRGQPIQSISQQSDCTLSIREPEASPFKDDRLLRIYGKAKGISLAQRLVIAYIRAYRADKGDPNYVDLSTESSPLVALPATSITKAMSVAVASGKKNEKEITRPFVWMVEREDVGKMMGRQGSTLAAIRQNTGAAIHLDKDTVPGTSERRVVLIGSVESIAAAIGEIKARSGGHPEVSASPSGRLGQYFAIPYHSSGFLIGPQGSTVKGITDRTGARLQIPSAEDLPLGSTNRILHMQGTPKQVEHARRVVGAKLRDYLSSSKNPRTRTPISTGKKGDKVTIKTLLPSRICGFMLDNRGKLVREISDKSGAHTHLLAPHDDESRVCVFSGEMSCVLRAQRLVLQVIAGDAISSKHSNVPRKRKRSHREEEEEEYSDAEEDMNNEGSYYDSDEEDNYEEYEEPRRLPVKRHRVPLRSRLEYREDDDVYSNDDEEEYDERPRQPIRRPVAARSREYIDEYPDDFDNGYNSEDFDEYRDENRVLYDPPRSRTPKRPAVVRRQPRARHQDEYSGDYEEYDDEYSYADDSDGYEHSLIARKQAVKRRPLASRLDSRRPPVVLPGRKVQMVAPKLSPREQRPRVSPTDRRRSNSRPSSARIRSNSRGSVPRGGRGSGRPGSSRGRGNGSKRRRL
ncbi:KH domain [Phytophthora infestans]|uniref:KH domain n=1 Tax=Phytophthora infestans TaxID=4787 RepID=A0A8S9TID9_PHYIN|nr:KH domain [Phytophthora infestans]